MIRKMLYRVEHSTQTAEGEGLDFADFKKFCLSRIFYTLYRSFYSGFQLAK